jgi:hypothetical protein
MTGATVLLADNSSSMVTPTSGGQRRIDRLSAILRDVTPTFPDARLYGFSDYVTSLEPGQTLPEPSGGTDMRMALDFAGTLSPRHVIVISDGEPADAKAALASARALNCIVSTFYCGDESNRAAIAFLKQLALCSRGGVGRPMIADLQKPEKLTADLRLLLSGPTVS